MGIHERKEREKEARREEILNAAQKIFFEKGLQDATMEEIAEVAELSKGTLYLYYSSKEDLYFSVMMRGLEILHGMFARSTEGTSSTLDAIWQLGKTYYEFFRKHRNFFRMFSYLQYPGMHKQVSPEIRTMCNTQSQKVWSVVSGLIEKGISEGLLKNDLNPMETAVILWSSSTSILARIDNEVNQWRNSLGVDLMEVLTKSNVLLMDAIMTEEAKLKYGSFPEVRFVQQSTGS